MSSARLEGQKTVYWQKEVPPRGSVNIDGRRAASLLGPFTPHFAAAEPNHTLTHTTCSSRHRGTGRWSLIANLQRPHPALCRLQYRCPAVACCFLLLLLSSCWEGRSLTITLSAPFCIFGRQLWRTSLFQPILTFASTGDVSHHLQACRCC